MPILSRPSSAARTSVLYITIGSLTTVWSSIWFWYLREHPPASDIQHYYCLGMLLTGLTVLVIGLALGQIGRAARHAELPPPEVTAIEAQVEQNAAARAPIIAPVNPAMPMGGPVVAAPVAPLVGGAGSVMRAPKTP